MATMVPPETNAIYSLPSNWYAIGEACQFCVLAWKLQSTFPVVASAATNEPVSSESDAASQFCVLPWKLQSTSPVVASAATTEPVSSSKKTSPVAVEIAPP